MKKHTVKRLIVCAAVALALYFVGVGVEYLPLVPSGIRAVLVVAGAGVIVTWEVTA